MDTKELRVLYTQSVSFKKDLRHYLSSGNFDYIDTGKNMRLSHRRGFL